jgi:hypothetical protein
MRSPRFTRALAGLATLVVAAAVHGATGDALEALQNTVGDWAKTRAETVRLETEWAEQRDLLRATASAMAERQRTLEQELELRKARSGVDIRETESLAARNKAATVAVAAMETELRGVAEKLTALRPSLPPRLSEGLEMAFRSMNAPGASPGERMQFAMTILSRCEQFNRALSFGDEIVRPGAAGEPVLMEVIYWGLSHGYALDRARHAAYLGRPGASGWSWEARPEAFESIERLLAVYRDDADPQFVAAPVLLAEPALEEAKP